MDLLDTDGLWTKLRVGGESSVGGFVGDDCSNGSDLIVGKDGVAEVIIFVMCFDPIFFCDEVSEESRRITLYKAKQKHYFK